MPPRLEASRQSSSGGDERTAAHMTPVNAIGGARCQTRLMIAQLPPDRMPPPRPEGIPRFQRLFREAAGLNFDKADLKHYEDFIDHRIYLLLLRAEANAKAGGDVVIEPWNLPITAGLQECIEQFRKMDETIELEPILDRLANRPPLQFSYSDETEAMLPDLAGGLGVAVARALKIIEPDLKKSADQTVGTRHADLRAAAVVYRTSSRREFTHGHRIYRTWSYGERHGAVPAQGRPSAQGI
jgi:hypothetical protein